MFHVQEVKPKETTAFVEKELPQNKSNTKEEKPVPPPPAQRRHTIATITKNDTIENNINDMRINGSLQNHLKHALNTKYKALRNTQEDSDGSF